MKNIVKWTDSQRHLLLIENAITLIENTDDLMQMLTWYKTHKKHISMPQVTNKVHINLPRSKSFKASVRINKTIWDEFGAFAEQHREFNKSDLVAQALKEFMEKY